MMFRRPKQFILSTDSNMSKEKYYQDFVEVAHLPKDFRRAERWSRKRATRILALPPHEYYRRPVLVERQETGEIFVHFTESHQNDIPLDNLSRLHEYTMFFHEQEDTTFFWDVIDEKVQGLAISALGQVFPHFVETAKLSPDFYRAQRRERVNGEKRSDPNVPIPEGAAFESGCTIERSEDDQIRIQLHTQKPSRLMREDFQEFLRLLIRNVSDNKTDESYWDEVDVAPPKRCHILGCTHDSHTRISAERPKFMPGEQVQDALRHPVPNHRHKKLLQQVYTKARADPKHGVRHFYGHHAFQVFSDGSMIYEGPVAPDLFEKISTEKNMNGCCDVCLVKKPKLQKCGKCRISAYCGIDCQRKDWSEHRKVCKLFQSK